MAAFDDLKPGDPPKSFTLEETEIVITKLDPAEKELESDDDSSIDLDSL